MATILSSIQSNLKGTASAIQSEGLVNHIKRRVSGQAASGLFKGLQSGLKSSGNTVLGSVMGQLGNAGGPFVKNKLTFMSTKFANASAASTPLERTKALLMPQLFEGKSSFADMGIMGQSMTPTPGSSILADSAYDIPSMAGPSILA
jgi:hypothetical protein